MTVGRDTSFLRNKAYSYVEDQLINGRWGLADRISEKALADELGISRTPVREAIRKLIVEGLLFQVPSSGTFLTKPNRTSIVEVFEVRRELGGFAAEAAAKQITDSELLNMERCFATMQKAAANASVSSPLTGTSLRRFVAGETAIQQSILTAAQNRLVGGIVHSGWLQTLVLETYTKQMKFACVSKTLEAFSLLLDGIRANDGLVAKRAYQSHVEEGMKSALSDFDERMTKEGEE